MAQHILLQIDGGDVAGECKVEGYDKWIDLDSYSIDFHQSGSFKRGGGGAGGGVSVGDLMLTKKLDSASPSLMRNVCMGRHYGKVIMHVMKNVGENAMEPYYIIELTDVIVSSYNVGGDADSDDNISENFSFNFREIRTEVFVQDEKGRLSQAGEMTYDVPAGVAG